MHLISQLHLWTLITYSKRGISFYAIKMKFRLPVHWNLISYDKNTAIHAMCEYCG